MKQPCPQSGYKHKITNTPVEFDYSYLDACATSTAEPYMWEITSETANEQKENLIYALEAIYENFAGKTSTFAPKKDAMNV